MSQWISTKSGQKGAERQKSIIAHRVHRVTVRFLTRQKVRIKITTNPKKASVKRKMMRESKKKSTN